MELLLENGILTRYNYDKSHDLQTATGKLSLLFDFGDTSRLDGPVSVPVDYLQDEIKPYIAGVQ